MINSRSFDHEEETDVAVGRSDLESLKSGLGHLGERGLNGSVSVDLVAEKRKESALVELRDSRRDVDSPHVRAGEKTHERKGSVLSSIESVESSSRREEVVA